MSAIKEYTRVFLASSGVRCVDGTRPLIYVDQAVCATPGGCTQPDGSTVGEGDDLVSNKWLISMTGGGACNAFDSDGDGKFDDGSRCTDLYPGEVNEMSSAFDGPMKNLTSTPGGSSGIMSPSPVTNPVFAAYNRVRIEKCSYDRYLGRAKYPNVTGILGAASITDTLYNHGQRIMEAALKQLKKGLAYTTWVPSGMAVTPVAATLPSLEDATHVVFVGHSGGAHGLYHNIDRLAATVRAAAGDTCDVRAVFDANFVPSIENEAAFNVPVLGDAYSDAWVGATVDDASAPITHDGEGFHLLSWFGQQQTSWKMRLDKSCLKAHAADERWKCRDRYHVLFNHVATPFFFREDFTDPNAEHTQSGNGHPIPWALPDTCTYPDLLVVLPTCDAPRFDPVTQHRPRLETQALTLLNARATDSEFATGADTTFEDDLPAVTVPTVYAWMPSCGSHEGAYGNDGFHDTVIDDTMTAVTMRTWLETFVAAPPTNVTAAKMDGMALGVTMTSTCP